MSGASKLDARQIKSWSEADELIKMQSVDKPPNGTEVKIRARKKETSSETSCQKDGEKNCR